MRSGVESTVGPGEGLARPELTEARGRPAAPPDMAIGVMPPTSSCREPEISGY